MTAPIRWGVLGAAQFAQTTMAPAIHGARGSVLAGLATSSPGKAEPFRALAPDLAVFYSYEALLASDAIDAVYVPLPNHLHVEWTLRALAAGKHVLTEKPIALAEPEFDRLIAARDAAGRLAAEAFMIVHHPQWRHARDLLAQGAIGRLVHVDGVFSYNNADDPGNIRNRAETGGGGVRDIGVYTLGAARFATGTEPERVSARLRRENGVDTFARIGAEFPGFSFGCVVSMRMSAHQRMTFHGETGVMTLSAPFNPGGYGQAEIHLENDDMTVTTRRFPGVDQYILQVEAFCRAARVGTPYDCPLEFSRGTQRMIDMVFAAAHDPGDGGQHGNRG